MRAKARGPVDVNKHVVITNHDKFDNQNAVTSRLVNRFMDATLRRVALLAPPKASVLDVGAGEGIMTQHLHSGLPGRSVEALEYEDEGCAVMRSTYPHIKVTQGSVYELPFADDSFDVVTAFEVLEHLEHTDQAFAEMARVARNFVVVTVPWEPGYRAGNVARGRYLNALGNTPGHLNHWNRATLRRDMSVHHAVAEVTGIFPWLLGTGSSSSS